MKLIFERPIQAGASFTDDGKTPFQLYVSMDDDCLIIEMSNDDAREIMDCLQSSFNWDDSKQEYTEIGGLSVGKDGRSIGINNFAEHLGHGNYTMYIKKQPEPDTQDKETLGEIVHDGGVDTTRSW